MYGNLIICHFFKRNRVNYKFLEWKVFMFSSPCSLHLPPLSPCIIYNTFGCRGEHTNCWINIFSGITSTRMEVQAVEVRSQANFINLIKSVFAHRRRHTPYALHAMHHSYVSIIWFPFNSILLSFYCVGLARRHRTTLWYQSHRMAAVSKPNNFWGGDKCLLCALSVRQTKQSIARIK